MSPYVLTLTKHLHFTGLTNCCVVFCVHWCGLPYFLAGFVLLFIVLPLNANIGETAENCGEAGRQSTGCRADQRPVAGGAAVKWTPLGGRRGYLNNFSQPVRPAEPWYRPRHRSHRTAGVLYCDELGPATGSGLDDICCPTYYAGYGPGGDTKAGWPHDGLPGELPGRVATWSASTVLY